MTFPDKINNEKKKNNNLSSFFIIVGKPTQKRMESYINYVLITTYSLQFPINYMILNFFSVWYHRSEVRQKSDCAKYPRVGNISATTRQHALHRVINTSMVPQRGTRFRALRTIKPAPLSVRIRPVTLEGGPCQKMKRVFHAHRALFLQMQ